MKGQFNIDLKKIRAQIDRVDEQIVALFCERMELSAAVAAAKRVERLPVEDETREQEILARVDGLAGEELAIYARALFSTLFKLSKSYQARLNVAEKPEL